MVAYRITRYE